MKKIYVDLSCDKVSGQQIMQRKFKDYCEECGILSEKEDADILVFVQVPPSQDVEEWQKLKQQGKKIVFIHHYLVKEIVDIVAIFKIPGLLELVDLHIIMSEHVDILTRLKWRGVSDRKIKIIEQAGVDRDKIERRFFYRARNEKTICYVGRARKGLDKFVELTKDLKGWHRSIFCPDVHKYEGDLSKYHIFSSLTGWDLFDLISRHQFLYSPFVYRQPLYHLETSIHEAVHCGTAVIVDDEFNQVIPNFRNNGFVRKDEFQQVDDKTRQLLSIRCSNFLYENFKSAEEIMRENLLEIQSYFRREETV